MVDVSSDKTPKVLFCVLCYIFSCWQKTMNNRLQRTSHSLSLITQKSWGSQKLINQFIETSQCSKRDKS